LAASDDPAGADEDRLNDMEVEDDDEDFFSMFAVVHRIFFV